MDKLDLYRMYEEKEKLEELSGYEMSEVGEMCNALLQLSEYPDYMSENLRDAVAKEIMEQLKYFSENYEWVDVEVPARPATTIKEFVYKG